MANPISRFWNLILGWLGLAGNKLEEKNPEAVFEAAINQRVNKYKELKQATSRIIMQRTKLQTELENKTEMLATTHKDITSAVESDDDALAVELIRRKNQLEARSSEIQVELQKVIEDADEARESLVSFKGDIDKLRREKDQMLAQKASAEARIKVQETLSGLSTDADIQALDNVRRSVEELTAEADMGSELEDSTLEARLQQVRQLSEQKDAAKELEAIKEQLASQNASQEEEEVEKTL